ncbi:MAG TPA: hypothetical protein DG757_00745 [Bacillus sp. (in: Bacteria)]|nr:hypothetical protein [Bacillus sp. (in: firmicutes)]
MKDAFRKQLHATFSVLDSIEGVNSVENIISFLNDKVIFPEITTLILNSKFELIYLFNEQKVMFRTLKEVTIDSIYINEINLINQHIHLIEHNLNGLINASITNNYSLTLLANKYNEKILNS